MCHFFASYDCIKDGFVIVCKINLTKEEIRNIDSNYKDRKPYYMQGIVSILLDTGIVGIFFLLSLFGITIFSIYDSKENIINKTFYVLLLAINFLSLFIGFPLVNLAYILFILPNGIIYIKNKK